MTAERPDRRIDAVGAADLGADYREAGFGRALDWGGRPALLLVDLVRAYFEPGAELYLGSVACLESAARVVAAARAAAIPVIHSRVVYGPGGVDGGLFFKKVGALRHFVGGGRLGEIMPEVAPLPDELVVVKQYASSFFGTPLAATLTSQSIDTVVICGVSTSGCVRATAVDAIQHGFVPIVVREGVGDRDQRPHEASLFDLQAKYAEVLGEAEVVAHLVAVGTRSDPGQTT